jgi:hypothetical protein
MIVLRLMRYFYINIFIFNLGINGLKLADSINQSWLVFDGAIIVWNSYLNVFCDKSNDSKLFPDIFKLLKEFFEVMRNQT